MSGRLKALFLLALALLKTLIVRAFSRRRDGIAQFRENYDADGLVAEFPIPAEILKRGCKDPFPATALLVIWSMLVRRCKC